MDARPRTRLALGLLNLLVGLSIRIMPEVGRTRRLISGALLTATVLIPGGFFLGGVGFYGGDPGLGVLILPIGATLSGRRVPARARRGIGAPAPGPSDPRAPDGLRNAEPSR